MDNLGNQIRALRRKRNLTQRDLAEAAGVHVNTLRYFEQGRRSPSIETTSLLLDVLGCELLIRVKPHKA